MKTTIITERDMILSVPAHWKLQYHHNNTWLDAEKADKYYKLQQLDLNTCTVDDITAIIGNASWTGNYCNICGYNNMNAGPWLRIEDQDLAVTFCSCHKEEMDTLEQKIREFRA